MNPFSMKESLKLWNAQWLIPTWSLFYILIWFVPKLKQTFKLNENLPSQYPNDMNRISSRIKCYFFVENFPHKQLLQTNPFSWTSSFPIGLQFQNYWTSVQYNIHSWRRRRSGAVVILSDKPLWLSITNNQALNSHTIQLSKG